MTHKPEIYAEHYTRTSNNLYVFITHNNIKKSYRMKAVDPQDTISAIHLVKKALEHTQLVSLGIEPRLEPKSRPIKDILRP